MNNKTLLKIVIIMLLFNVVFVPLIQGIIYDYPTFPKSNGNTLYVGGTGEGNYTKIQDAINDANDGDTVFVFNGTYYESIIVNSSINLFGECRNSTFIYGDWNEDGIINIVNDWVNLSGFSIRWGDYIGIKINSDYNTLSDNNISESWGYGIYVSNTANYNCIIRNFIYDVGYYNYGIFLDSTHSNIIIDNTISKNMIGISIDFSNNNIIENNNFSGNENCIYLYFSNENKINNNTFIDNGHGIMLRNSSNNILIGNYLNPYVACTTFDLKYAHNNIIKNNTLHQGSNLDLYRSDNNTIYGNTLLQCIYGIYLMNSSYNTIFYNNLISCYHNGVSILPYYLKDFEIYSTHRDCKHINKHILNNNKNTANYGNNNFIFHNNFINNSKNAYDICNNTWDDEYPSGGNYWDDYNGTDDNGDGIGDTPYYIPGGDNEDRYPFISPIGSCIPIANFTYSIDESPVFFNGTSSYDSDGYLVFYEWDFGDGNKGYGETIYHKFCYIGTYNVTLTVTDNVDLKGRITKSVEVTKANIPPSLEVYGSNRGRPGVEYEYVFIGSDPDGDEFLFSIDWGDGSFTSWMGPLEDGESMNVSHIWDEPGSFIIKTRLKYFCDESDGGSLEITIPRKKVIYNILFNLFFERLFFILMEFIGKINLMD